MNGQCFSLAWVHGHSVWAGLWENSKKLNRKNTDGVGVLVRVRNLKKSINPPDFLVVEAANEIIDRLPFSPNWKKSQLLFVLSLGLPLEVTVLVKNSNKAKSPGHERSKDQAQVLALFV